MKIYILNDENTYKVLSLLKSIQCGGGIEQNISIFSDENRMLEYSAENKVHVAIFNEKAGEYSGYEFAYRLRLIDKSIMPIILRGESAIDEMAGEAELFGCVTMGNIDDKLPALIGYAAKRVLETESFLLSYYWNCCERTIGLDRILYFRSRHRVIEIICLNGVEGEFYKKLDELEEELQKQSVKFVRIGKSYLVNPKHILEKNRQEVVLDSGERLHITKKYNETMRS